MLDTDVKVPTERHCRRRAQTTRHRMKSTTRYCLSQQSEHSTPFPQLHPHRDSSRYIEPLSLFALLIARWTMCLRVPIPSSRWLLSDHLGAINRITGEASHRTLLRVATLAKELPQRTPASLPPTLTSRRTSRSGRHVSQRRWESRRSRPSYGAGASVSTTDNMPRQR